MEVISGIYKIINLSNNKYYLGSSVDIYRRFKEHFTLLRGNRHHSRSLQNAFNKYGEELFTLEITEQTIFNGVICKEYKMEYLQCLEQYYLDLYNVYTIGYNCSKKADYPFVKRTKESLEKSKNTRILRNTKMSQETKNKISISNKNSEKVTKANRRTAETRKIKIYQYSLDGSFIKEWRNKDLIEQELNILKYNIDYAVLKSNSSTGGYMFKKFKVDKLPPFIKNTSKGKLRLRRYILLKDLKTNNIIKIFDNREECCNYLDVSVTSLSSRIQVKEKINQKYYLEYGEYHR